MAPENELLSSWREELRQQANQDSGREELEGGGEEQEGENEMLDENGNVEKTITDSESEEQFRASLRREKTGRRRGSVAVKMEEGMTLFLGTSRWTCFAEFHLCVKKWVSVCDNS